MTAPNNTLRNILIGAALVAAGIAGTLIVQRSLPASHDATAPVSVPSAASPGAASGAPPMAVSLSPELIARAGVRAVAVGSGRVTSALRVPGNVETNAYKQVTVTPVAGGRVTAVMAELGQDVREGQTLVEIFSPELAEAERDYLSARADLMLVEQRRARTEKLGAIGAVSQQELEDVRAEHKRQTNAVEGARSRLRLLGLAPDVIDALNSADDITSVIRVPAPSSGVVVTRTVNRGQNVDMTMALMTIADLSSVWVIADVYERDMMNARVGGAAHITSAAVPGQSWTGRIAYVDPQVSTDTRTVKARIEVPNPRRTLTPGMLVEVELTGAARAETVVIPRTALQQVGGRTIVFTGAQGARSAQGAVFEVREVRVGAVSGDSAEILSGLAAGDQVVVEGAFALKAEWERIGGRLPAVTAPPPAPVADRGAAVASQRVTLKITEQGFEPASLRVIAGIPIELIVTRMTDNTCGTEIVIGTNGPRADLPLNEPVTMKIPAMAKGEVTISCGMAMLKGLVVAR